MRNPPASLLLIRLTSMGDVVHVLPTISDLKSAWPDTAIDWLVEEPFAPIARRHRGIRQVIPVSLRRWWRTWHEKATWREAREFIHNLRGRSYDVVLDVQGLIKSATLGRMARGAFFGADRSSVREPLAAFFYQYHLKPPAPWNGQHAVLFGRMLAARFIADYTGATAVDPTSSPVEYGLVNPTASQHDAWPSPYCVMMLFSSKAAKMWPLDHWREVGNALESLGYTCVLPAGSQAEAALRDDFAQRWPTAVTPPVLDLNNMMDLLSHASLTLAPDTGLAHLSVALGRPTICIFQSTVPGRTGLYGTTPLANLGGSGQPVAPAEVMATARRLLPA